MISRRDVLKVSAAGLALAAAGGGAAVAAPALSRVWVVRTADRRKAVEACLQAAAFNACEGKPVALKANFNSADPFPASTHPDTLAALLAGLKARQATKLTLGERSGMGETRKVLKETGALELLAAAGAEAVILDELERKDWKQFQADHWPRGFHAARLFTDSACAVQTMCCKTHRFGGHVTLSLKNTVGLVAKTLPGEEHDYMRDLHRSDHQRAMIAEVNQAYRPALSVMDCLEIFVDDGPEKGRRAAPGIFLASEDRCALDAAAIALLRLHGAGGPAAKGPIGKTDQLARAIELGLGAPPSQVELVPVDAGAREVAGRLAGLLAAG